MKICQWVLTTTHPTCFSTVLSVQNLCTATTCTPQNPPKTPATLTTSTSQLFHLTQYPQKPHYTQTSTPYPTYNPHYIYISATQALQPLLHLHLNYTTPSKPSHTCTFTYKHLQPSPCLHLRHHALPKPLH